LSALRTGRLYSQGNISGTHFCQRLIRPQGHSAAERIMSMKNSNDIIGNRTRDLLACSPSWSRRLRENVSQLINNSTPIMHLALPYTTCTKIMLRNILLSTCLCSHMVSDREHVCRVLNRVQCSLTDRESWWELWNKTQMKRSIIRSICPEVAECLTNFR
jgi:hypothetical protein